MKKPAKKILLVDNQTTNDIISGIVKGIDLSLIYYPEVKKYFIAQTGQKIKKNKFTYSNAKAVYDLCVKTIPYKAEDTSDQTIYTINRIIDKTLKTGDCKHNAIFNFCTLYALGVPLEKLRVRFVSWKKGQNYRHVYVILLTSGKGQIILDPVAASFDKELKYDKKIDLQLKN
jgi:hypothetical protein